MNKPRQLLLGLLFFLLLTGAGYTSLRAANTTLVVDTVADDLLLLACTPAPVDCSLRGAITRANADPANAYVIELQPGAVYTLTLPRRAEDANATGDGGDGGGLANFGSALVRHSQFLYNQTASANGGPPQVGGHGGAIYNNGVLTIGNSQFIANRTGDGNPGAIVELGGRQTGASGGHGGSGGAIANTGMLTVVNSLIMGNRTGSGEDGNDNGGEPGWSTDGGSAGAGGGVWAYRAFLTSTTTTVLINNTIVNNTLGTPGIGACDTYHGPCTVRNGSPAAGPGVAGDSSVTLTNSILWGNVTPHTNLPNTQIAGDVQVAYSLVQGGAAGVHNLDGTPGFLGPNDFRLTSLSPTINRGIRNALPLDVADLDGDGATDEELPLDLADLPRVHDGQVDMGAYEYLGTVDLLFLPVIPKH